MPVTVNLGARAGLVLASLALAGSAAAHGSEAGLHPWGLPSWPWTGEALLGWAQALFAVAWGLYVLGSARVRPPLSRRVLFHATMLLAAVTLFGPLDRWASRSAAWHMAQHMLLIAAVAPLLVLARPLASWRATLGSRLDRLWRLLARASRRPMACALLHAVAVWFWHAPAPYVAALQHTGLHLLEHASFLFTGWLFWWAVLRPARAGLLPAAMALVFTVTHTGMLGALLTFAPAPLYGGGQQELAEQQLAGLLMWIPGGMVYLAAAAAAGFGWLAGMERRSNALPGSPRRPQPERR